MSPAVAKHLKYYLRLDYPRHVTCAGEAFRGYFPDLPGTTAEDSDLRKLYARLDALRRQWIAERLDRGLNVPMPNSTFQAEASGVRERPSE